MTFDEAQRLIRDPSVDYVDHMEASMILAEHPGSTADDLQACIALGGFAADLARTRHDEAAAAALEAEMAGQARDVMAFEVERLPMALAAVLRSSSQGMTIPQIAAAMGLSSNMVARRLSQARRAIDERLQEGRVKVYESMQYGTNPLQAGTPVAFDVLCNEMRSLGLSIQLAKSKGSMTAADPRDVTHNSPVSGR